MPENLAPLCKAAGEPARLRILNLLRGGTRCVCDVQGLLGLPQPTVSRHLAALRHAGLVRDERRGPRVLYSLVRCGSPLQQAFLRLLDRACELDPSLCREADLCCRGPRSRRPRRRAQAGHREARRARRIAAQEFPL